MKKLFRLLILLLSVQAYAACDLSGTENNGDLNTISGIHPAPVAVISSDNSDTSHITTGNIYVIGNKTILIVPGTVSNIKIVYKEAPTTKSVKKAKYKRSVKEGIRKYTKKASPSRRVSGPTKTEIKNQSANSPASNNQIIFSCSVPSTVVNDCLKFSRYINFTIASYSSRSIVNSEKKCRRPTKLQSGILRDFKTNALFARPPTV